MKFSKYLIVVMILSSLTSFAQNPTTGGGKGPAIFAANYEEEMRELKKEINSWMNDFKGEWSNCYTSRVRSNDIVDLHMFLSVTEAFTPPKLKKKILKAQATTDCNEHQEDMFACAFQNYFTNKKLEAILSHPYFIEYLKSKGVTNKESHEILIKFFKHQIGTVKDAAST